MWCFNHNNYKHMTETDNSGAGTILVPAPAETPTKVVYDNIQDALEKLDATNVRDIIFDEKSVIETISVIDKVYYISSRPNPTICLSNYAPMTAHAISRLYTGDCNTIEAIQGDVEGDIRAWQKGKTRFLTILKYQPVFIKDVVHGKKVDKEYKVCVGVNYAINPELIRDEHDPAEMLKDPSLSKNHATVLRHLGSTDLDILYFPPKYRGAYADFLKHVSMCEDLVNIKPFVLEGEYIGPDRRTIQGKLRFTVASKSQDRLLFSCSVVR